VGAESGVVPGGAVRRSPGLLTYAVLAVILLAAAVLRYTGLEALSLWYDEGWSYYVAALTPAEALRALVQYADPHPPGYYLLLIAWCRVFGLSTLTLRALSASLGVLEVGAMFLLGREVASSVAPDDRAASYTGLLAAALLALAPADIMYSHDGRMYTLLGLCATLLLTLYYRYGCRRAAWRPYLWIPLVLCEALALYTHFFAVFVVAGLAIWLSVRLCLEARAGHPRALWHWLISQGAVVLLYLPWLPVTLDRAAGHTTGSSYVPPPGRFLADTWSFMLSGQTDLLAPNPAFALLAWTALALVILAAGAATLRGSLRRPLVFLALQCALPVTGVYLLTMVRPGFHPRYLLMILYPLMAVIAITLAALWSRTAYQRRSWPWRAGAIAVLALWLVATGVGGHLARATAPWRDDARGLVAELAQDMPADSGVLAAYTGWELRPYLKEAGLQGNYVSTTRPQAELEAELASWLDGRAQAAYVRWGQSDTDHAGVIAYLLSQRGRLIDERAYPGYAVSIYALDSGHPDAEHSDAKHSDAEHSDAEHSQAERREAGMRFGPLVLVSYSVPIATPADGALAVALDWRLRETTGQDLKVSVTLWDSAEHLYSQTDRALQDVNGQGTSRWSAGAEVTDYVTLPLGGGLPTGEYTLQISVYNEGDLSALEATNAAGAPAGRRWSAGRVAISPPRADPPASAVPPLSSRLGLAPLLAPTELAPGLALTAARLERTALSSGERLGVILEWQRTSTAPLPALYPELQFVRDGEVLVRQLSHLDLDAGRAIRRLA
jgi:uncharacterized membrane protein